MRHANSDSLEHPGRLRTIVGGTDIFNGTGIAMGLMATSTDATTMNFAQAMAGIVAAAAATLVVLIASNYRGRQQETALAVLAGIPAVASAAPSSSPASSLPP